ncbi:MAG: N-acetyltransferase family protein [Granulosicoccus sp.]
MTEMRIRPAVFSDAEGFLELWEALDTETQFMLFEPGERKETLDRQRVKLENAQSSQYVNISVLEDVATGLIAGFCAGRRNSNFRDRLTAEIVIGIRQHYTGKRWGHKLLTELETWALGAGVHRLELSVMTTNLPAIALYKNCGFVIEGTKKDAVRLKSGFFDEYTMAKLI